MRKLAIALFLLCTINCFGQKYLDKKIIVTVDDTTNLYQKVREAFGKNNFQVKEDGNVTSITTFPRESKRIPGFVLSKAEIAGNTVTLNGIYGFIRMDYLGYTRSPNSYKDILYMKGSKLWPLLMSVAKELGNKISYSK